MGLAGSGEGKLAFTIPSGDGPYVMGLAGEKEGGPAFNAGIIDGVTDDRRTTGGRRDDERTVIRQRGEDGEHFH